MTRPTPSLVPPRKKNGDCAEECHRAYRQGYDDGFERAMIVVQEQEEIRAREARVDAAREAYRKGWDDAKQRASDAIMNLMTTNRY